MTDKLKNTENKPTLSIVKINVDLKEASKAVKKFVDSVSRGLGILYEPYRIKKLASALTEASAIIETADEATKALFHRTLTRQSLQEMGYQKNIEAITQSAMKALPGDVNDEPVDDDWLTYFFEKCKTVSDENMQMIWSRILAGEVSKPGSYSLRTLNLIRLLDKQEAEIFTNFCGYVCSNKDGHHRMLITDAAESYLKVKGFHGGHTTCLMEAGLINDGFFMLPKDDNNNIRASIIYFDKEIELIKPPQKHLLDKIYGICPLTNTGHELLPICGAKPDYDYYDCLVESYKKEGFQVG